VQAFEGSDLVRADWRAYAFRICLWALIAVLYFFSPFVLVVLGWFQEPFSELGGAESVSHRVHEVLFGVIFAQAMVGAISQLRNPIGRRAGMLQTLAALLGFVAALAAIGEVELLGVSFVALAIIATLLHPAGRVDWRGSWHPLRGLVLLAFSGVVPLVVMATDNFAKASVQAADHLTHWGGVAAFAIVQLLLAIIASLRPPGYRLVAGSVGAAGLVYLAASFLFPFDASARPQFFAVWLGIWSLSWLVVATVGQLKSSAMAGLGALAIIFVMSGTGLVGTSLAAFLAAVLLVLARRQEGFPRFLSIALSAFGYLLIVGGGLVASAAGEPTFVPHGLVEGYADATRQTCLECHSVGAGGATRIPHEPFDICGGEHDEDCWDGRRDCLGCHRYDPVLGGPTEAPFPPGGGLARPPTGGTSLSPQQLTAASAIVLDSWVDGPLVEDDG
jgi:hypothetical protein